MSFSVCSNYDLPIGRWVEFVHDKKITYTGLRGPFFVLNYADINMFSIYFLMNINGQLMNYCPKWDELEYADLPRGYKISVITKENINNLLGEKVKSLKPVATQHLKNLACRVNFEKGFNPDSDEDNKPTLSSGQIREKYGLTLKSDTFHRGI